MADTRALFASVSHTGDFFRVTFVTDRDRETLSGVDPSIIRNLPPETPLVRFDRAEMADVMLSLQLTDPVGPATLEGFLTALAVLDIPVETVERFEEVAHG